jgi:hypothetical protein
MSMEQNLLLMFWVVGIALITFTVPRGKWHAFLVALLTCQGMAWLTEVAFVKSGIVVYPVREFPKASDLSITMEVMLVPVCCSLYVIYEPVRSWAARLRHLVVWTAGFTLIDLAVARFTRLQDHHGFHWWMIVLVFAGKLGITNAIVRWFFRNRALFRQERRSI